MFLFKIDLLSFIMSIEVFRLFLVMRFFGCVPLSSKPTLLRIPKFLRFRVLSAGRKEKKMEQSRS